MRKYHFRQDILIAESYMKFAAIWMNKIDKRKQAANRLTYASCECCSKNSPAKNTDQHCIKYHICNSGSKCCCKSKVRLFSINNFFCCLRRKLFTKVGRESQETFCNYRTMMSNFVEMLYRQLLVLCLCPYVLYDILFISVKNIYSYSQLKEGTYAYGTASVKNI